jgi:hypothetical protein
MKMISTMTEDELRDALRWCMHRLQEHWKGGIWSETWGREGSPWAFSEAKPLSKPQAKIGEAT